MAINHTTSLEDLTIMVNYANNCNQFTIDTESDIFSNQPALIQIELIRSSSSKIILIETSRLPSNKLSSEFSKIEDFLRTVLKPSNTIYSWGNIVQELKQFLFVGLFNEQTLEQLNVVDIQREFKLWIHVNGQIDSCGIEKWSLQAAIARQFKEFLDKSERLNKWSVGLFRHGTHHPYSRKTASMIKYAANDCLATTKLAFRIDRLD